MPYASTALRLPSLAEQTKILNTTGKHVAGYRDHMIFSLALGSALREHEIVALDVGDVVDSKGAIRPRLQLKAYKGRKKTKKARAAQFVFLNRTLRAKLATFVKWKRRRGELVGPDDPLFVGTNIPHDRLSTRTIRYQCHRWQKEAGIDLPYNFHSFRHACLTNLYRNTKNLRVVQRMARHSDVNMTQIYAHVSDDEVARGADGIPC
jgi:integrase/recombinase XerC